MQAPTHANCRENAVSQAPMVGWSKGVSLSVMAAPIFRHRGASAAGWLTPWLKNRLLQPHGPQQLVTDDTISRRAMSHHDLLHAGHTGLRSVSAIHHAGKRRTLTAKTPERFPR
jgi:hypothetical protein